MLSCINLCVSYESCGGRQRGQGSRVRVRLTLLFLLVFFFSSRRRHTRSLCDWSSDVCSSDLVLPSNNTLTSGIGEWSPTARPPVFRFESLVSRAGGFEPERPESRRLLRRNSWLRSEERRVGKECRFRWSPGHSRKE